jgi:hypothetical protein
VFAYALIASASFIARLKQLKYKFREVAHSSCTLRLLKKIVLLRCVDIVNNVKKYA